MPYVNFFPVVVDRRNESGLIPSNVKNREFSNLVSVGKNRSHLLNIREISAPHLFKPLNQACLAIRVDFSKIVQSLTRNDMHGRRSLKFAVLIILLSMILPIFWDIETLHNQSSAAPSSKCVSSRFETRIYMFFDERPDFLS